MNVKLLRKIQEHILAEPRRFRMSGYSFVSAPGTIVGPSEYCGDIRQVVPECGTMACIAGWATGLDGGDIANAGADTGAQHLQLPELVADRLFFMSQWPEKFSEAYRSATTVAAKAQIAAERIDHFIATEGAE